MGASKTLKQILASAFVAAGGVAIFTWIWPNDGSLLFAALAVLSAVLSLAVVASLWQK